MASLADLLELNKQNLLTRKDLEDGKYGHKYLWEADRGDDEHKKRLDSFLLDRGEGYEVLYLINKIARELKIEDKKTGFKIENLIHSAPSRFHKTTYIEEWVKDGLK